MSSCYWKLGQTENVFNVDCKIRATGRKIFSVVIFTSNHFRRRAKRERERERTHKRANRERERERERDHVVEPTIVPVRLPSSSPPRDCECSVHPTPAKEDPSHSADPFFIVTNPVNDPPLSQSDNHEQPTPEPTHPWADPVNDPLRRPIPHRHIALFVSISLSLCHLSPSLTIDLGILIFFVLIFVSLIVYISWFSVIIFVWILRKCEKHDKNGFFRAFSGTQPNTRKYFPKHFLEYNQTLENIFLSRKYFHLKIFYIQPNAA